MLFPPLFVLSGLQSLGEAADEEPAEEDTDEIDPAVEASDTAIVNEVAAELDTETLPSLTREEINLGRFSLSKVSFKIDLSSHDTQTICELASKPCQTYLQ